MLPPDDRASGRVESDRVESGRIASGRIASVLLAAGGGSRFSGETHKLLAPLADGRTVVEHAFAVMREGSPTGSPLIVVSGAVVLPELVEPEDPDVVMVANPRWANGQSTSVWAALDAAQSLGCDAVIVGLGDSPGIAPQTWAAMHAGLGAAIAEGASIAVATFNGKRGNPVGLSCDIWPLLPRDADEGARSLIAARPDLVREVACFGTPADIDTVEDLQTWRLS